PGLERRIDAMKIRSLSFVVGFALSTAAAAPALGQTQTTTRVSLATGGLQGDGDCFAPAFSATGRFVAFYGEASTLVPGGAKGDGRSYYPVLSADGRFVAFHGWASNLVAGDTNGKSDVFVRDLASGITTCASVGLGGAQANGDSEYPVPCADGSRVVF